MRLALVVLLTFPLAFGPIWGGATWLASRLGGWSVLAAHYRTSGGWATSERLSFRNGWMGWLGYGWALELGVEGDHLRLDVAWPFRIGHPPLAVPLDEVRITREAWVLGERARFHFAAAPGVRLRTFPGTAEALAARAGGRLRVEKGAPAEGRRQPPRASARSRTRSTSSTNRGSPRSGARKGSKRAM